MMVKNIIPITFNNILTTSKYESISDYINSKYVDNFDIPSKKGPDCIENNLLHAMQQRQQGST